MSEIVHLSSLDDVAGDRGAATAPAIGRGLFPDMPLPVVPESGSPQDAACKRLASRVERIARKVANAKGRKGAFAQAAKGLRNTSKALIGKKLGLDFVEYAPTDPMWNFYTIATAIADALTYGLGPVRPLDEAVVALGAVDLDLSHLGDASDPRRLPLRALVTLAEQLLNMPAEENA
jgi:hypothetical protein